MGKFKNEIGNVYGRLTVIERVENNKRNQVCWRCSCSCGKENIIPGILLRNGNTSSCGCLRGDMTSRATKTHGMTETKIYYIWKAMKERCRRVKNAAYKNYGGRGISVCKHWHKFENFYSDMGERPEGMSLDRIDNNGNYEPSNVKWSSREEQNSNTRQNHYVNFKGKTYTINRLAREVGIDRRIIGFGLAKGKSIEEILKD